MSITKTRTFIEKSGCGWITGGAIILVLIGGMFYQCNNSQQGQNQPGAKREDNTPAVATVGGLNITSGMVQSAFDQRQQQMRTAAPTPETELAAYGQAIYSWVDQGLRLEALRANGFNPTNEEVLKLAEPSIDMNFFMLKFQLEQSGQLKPNSTQAEFDELLKKNTGKDQATLRKEELAQIKENLADPKRKGTVLASVANELLREKLATKIQVTDDEIKKSFDTYKFKRIRVGTGPDAPKKLEEAQAALKGGMSFEAAMEKYSNESAPPGKKKAESTAELPYTSLISSAYYEPLLKLGKGGVSEPIEEPGVGPTLYKLIDITSKPPKDWEKTKEDTRKQLAAQKASAVAEAEVDKARKNAKIEWFSPGFKVLYEYTKVINDPELSKQANADPKIMRAIIDEAAKVPGEDSIGVRVATLTKFGAFNQIWLATKPADRAALETERLAILGETINVIESPDVRLDMADILVNKKDGKGAIQQLTSAANGNITTDALGQSRYSRIYSILEKVRRDKLATDEEIKAVEDIQKAWQQRSLEQAKFEEEERKMREDAAKRAEEERKKEMEKNKPVERGKTEGSKTETPATTGATTGK
ncbi:MAG: hypothetical protein HONBIEJF_01479 [Fimbriimonadaceae bacterium]|nr:hypothetical protein [Fimbriimonadaceae bacterium]